MNYYPHHIGDFNNATRHLTRLERSIYRDLIEFCYDSEQPLPLDIGTICRKIIAHTEEEKEAVKLILDEFFEKSAEGWINSRCMLEIEKYQTKIAKQVEAGKASGRARAKSLKDKDNTDEPVLNECPTDAQPPFDGCSTYDEPTSIQKPVTKNQKPKTKNHLKDKKKKKTVSKVVSVEFIKEKEAEYIDRDISKELEAFYGYCEAHGKKYVSYNHAFGNWLRNGYSPIYKNSSSGKSKADIILEENDRQTRHMLEDYERGKNGI